MIFAIIKLWLVALVVDASNITTIKHYISTEDFNSLKFAKAPPLLPIDFSPRIRRQQAAGVLSFVYNTDTDESSGKWGDWNSDQDCSRTCGGGVLVESRECQDGDCTGPSKRYSSCNTQECPPNTKDFRLEQCQKFNSVPFERKLYDWIPYLKAPRKCELNCMPRGERFYYRHEKMVVDGTPCDLRDGFRRVCVEGECIIVGCDGMLGSTVQEDNCRICGGNGADCNTVTGELLNEDMTMGYNDLILIPAGATNIRITEMKASNNYLALRNTEGKYYINGNWRIDFPNDYEAAGTVAHYERTTKGGGKRARLLSMFAPEQIRMLGPTNEPLYVVMLYQETNPGVEFEYSIPSESIKATPSGGEGYVWSPGPWSPCPSECGGASKTRTILCTLGNTKEIVADNLCDETVKPPTMETCNEEPCQPEWAVGDWSNCTAVGAESESLQEMEDEIQDDSGSAGNGSCPGIMLRNVFCQQMMGLDLLTVVDEDLCEGDKPTAQKLCSESEDDEQQDSEPKYHLGPWGGCSALCGAGIRQRKVTCFSKLANGTIEELNDEDCTDEKPDEEEPCQSETPCEATDWLVTEWSGCSQDSCGLVKESRDVICADAEGNLQSNASLCDETRLPELSQACEEEQTQELCQPSWFASQWSVCSSKCLGIKGVQTRVVYCGTKDENTTISLSEDESVCTADMKPELEQECQGTEECTGTWFTTIWSQCTVSCGGGTYKRNVMCLHNGEPVDPGQCDAEAMPASDGDCNVEDCPEASGDDEETEDAQPEYSDGSQSETCKEYYDDYWIFGEEGSGETETEEEEDEEGSGSGSGDKELTKEELQAIFGEKRCKPEALVLCSNTTFGCCPDEFNAATGPFDEGCPQYLTCGDTRYGCCLDGATVALGRKFEGCPPSTCDQTLFGCCSDGETPASGPDAQGCDENKSCENGPFGCCPDKRTFAQGPHKQGCFECPEEVWMCDACEKTEFGCCVDLENAARGPNFEGCPDDDTPAFIDCATTEHGCCPDGLARARGPEYKGCEKATPCKDSVWGCCEDLIHPAHGPNKEGCCLSSTFGCCQDNINEAKGPNFDGCSCEGSEFGCCPDDFSKARGPDHEGCGCVSTEHGCCPDNFTPAQGPGNAGCLCHTYEYGCCPDGKAIARGPGQEGCSCKDTEFGCCPDRKTPASGIDGEGCGCAASWFGCCPDGEMEAEGEEFEGCDSELTLSTPDVCGLEKDRGEGRNFTTKWFFDMEYGGCSRFWYGGDAGNRNNFEDRKSCDEVCVDPIGRDACLLPKVPGPCEGYYPRWGYDAESKSCTQFVYGGCLGNNNKYETKEECEAVCVEETELSLYLVDKCDQPIKPGPCLGNFTRWGYNQETEVCEEFNYGGCKGNLNSFLTEDECSNSCASKETARDMCLLPRSKGPCMDMQPKWYFDNLEKRCMPFYFGGCEGNANRFDSEEDCRRSCPSAFLQDDVCKQPEETGPCRDYLERYYFDSEDGTCKLFYYGGCEGNKNNFKSLQTCQSRCSVDFSIPIQEDFKLEFCFLAMDEGTELAPSKDIFKRWYYDSSDGTCKDFEFKGKKGNGNRFLTRQECQASCQPSQDVCSLPKVQGPCDDQVEMYWYDKSKDECFTFDWGGCHGNGNRFETQEFCDKACKRSGPGVASYRGKKRPGPQGSLVSICNLPRDVGTGEEKTPQWFYDSDKNECTAFLYSGEGGNANRFTTQEQCDRECGIFRDQDVCHMERDPGPCIGRFQKWYYNVDQSECQEFTFGGCEGNGNRFSNPEECESVCLFLEEPQITGSNIDTAKTAICEMEVDEGSCDDGRNDLLKRWHFNAKTGTCVPFIYVGCAGNRNRFKSSDLCLGFCDAALDQFSSSNPSSNTGLSSTSTEEKSPLSFVTEPPLGPRPDLIEDDDQDDDQNEIDEEYDESRCQDARDHCNRLKCEYGMIRYHDDRTKCIGCVCNEPCLDYQCPSGKQCKVEMEQSKSGQINFRAVCRKEKKPGVCPKLSRNNKYASCTDECYEDSDCVGNKKCCYNGCARSCLPGVKDLEAEDPDDLDTQGVDPNAPKIRVESPRVITREGNVATLRVYISGNPTPDVYWRKNRRDLSKDGKYKIIEGGTLQIIGVDLSDEGEYTCIADNGRGVPDDAKITLAVDDPVELPAQIIDSSSSDLVMSLGSPAHLKCLAYGHPKPTVSWWRDGTTILPVSTDNLEQTSGYGLRIRRVGLKDLGHYTCQAYNGLGPAESSSFVLTVIGPIDRSSIDREDQPYLRYVVDAPTNNIYRPPPPDNNRYRPGPLQPPRTNDQRFDWSSASTTIRPVIQTIRPRNRPETGYIDVRIDLPRSRFPINDKIVVPCTVNSYSRPNVVWKRNGRLLASSQRIQIMRDNNTLIIFGSRASDSGTYTCEADNGYNRDASSVNIRVENIQVSQECTDNPYFANCKLIVKAEYCTNKYYAKFCCKSCTLAGQLRGY